MIHQLLTRPAPQQLYWRGDTQGEHTLRWTGVAGFTLTNAQKTLVIDPFVTRTGLMKTAFGRLSPDKALLREWYPSADSVLVGHAHYDHVLGAPELCMQTGATLYGCSSTANVARGYGLPEDQIVTVVPDQEVKLAHGRAKALPSQHGKFLMGRGGYPSGTIDEPLRWPPKVGEMKHGQVFTWWAEWGGLRIVHVDSADYDTARMKQVDADVVCLCAIGRHYRPGFTREILEATRPKYVVPCHWDHFFMPFDAPTRQLPTVDVEGFVEEIESCGFTSVLLPIGGSLGIS